MKLGEIFRFEFAYQLRRPWFWLSVAVLIVFGFEISRAGIVPVTLPQDFILNSPFIITTVTVLSCQIWLLIAPAVAGEAAARDVQMGMHPLNWTSPISKGQYLGGRFAAAFALNSLILLGVQVGGLLAVYGPWTSPEIVGPFRPVAYLAAFVFVALTNAFIATTFQFAAALLSGRPMAAYVGSMGLFFLSYPVTLFLYLSGMGERALLVDPIGVFAIMNEMMSHWTLVEKNVRMFTLEGPMLWNRLLWLGIAVLTNVFIYHRFRFAHRTAYGTWSRPWSRLVRRYTATAAPPGAAVPDPASARVTGAVPHAARSFGLATRLRQAWVIARSSFWMIAKSPAGLFLLAVYPMFVALVLVVEAEHWGVPLQFNTGYILAKDVTASLTHASDYRVIVPILIIFFAGELVWRERDAGLSENIDATPVPEWVPFLGKYLGLGLVLAALMTTLSVAGMLAQRLIGQTELQPDLYLTILFGLQLPEYLLFAMLALFVHVVVNQKHIAMVVALTAFAFMVFPSVLGRLMPFSSGFGIEHNLVVYGSGPAWSYTAMRGFGGSVGPWLWFKLYWGAWALLLAVAATVLWVRGRETGAAMRLRNARLRVTRATAGAAVLALVLITTLGGFIFYNTNVLREFITAEEMVRRRAEYEKRYGHYEGIPQPARVATSLHIEVYPDRRAATIRGSYRMVNRAAVPIAAVHLEPAFYVDTRVAFDRPFTHRLADEKLGHHIYALEEPLQPGDSLMLSFEVDFRPRGFANGGASMAIVENGSHFTSGALPVIGYQPLRELWSAEDRRKHGLPRQLTLPPPGDIDPHTAASPAATFEAVMGTSEDQVAVAPGELRNEWREGGRRYFHYRSDAPLTGTEVFFSADYAVHRERWHDVEIAVFLHPGHTRNLDRLLLSARASLDYYSEQFGPYPYPFLQFVEQPGNFLGMGVDGSGVVTAGEGIFHLNPNNPERLDVMFQVVAHEVAHQWWGMQLKPAFVGGGGVISESLAWYSAMQLVKKEMGREQLRQLMRRMREPNPWPPMRTGLPLLSAMDPWANYRKGPYAFHALSEYIGEERVNGALRTLIEKKRTSLATTLDMYQELQAVTPDSLKPLLHDLFEVNALWTFDTKSATAKQLPGGEWQVTLEVEATKTVSDSAGRERAAPIRERVEIGIFAAAAPGQILGRPLHLQKHRIRSGTQTITVTVSERPARAGIDPYNLLDWEEGDNIERIGMAEARDGV